MLTLNYKELQIVFNQWSKQYSLIPSSEWISIDGKSLKNTVSNYDNAEQNFINCVSAFSHQRKLVLGVKMSENQRESEINVVRDLIELLDLTGVVFTFDALHCQKKTLIAIALSGNDYLVKVKTNQPKLYKQIETASNQQKPRQTVKHIEQTRDRNSYRQVEVFEPPENLDPKWIGVGCVIKVERTGTRSHQPYQSISYYLCSLSSQSQRLADGIRGHWLIENSLHWVKDVIYEEDISPQKAGFAPRNLSLLKTWVLTFLRVHGFDSIKGAIGEMSHNIGYMLTFCT